jgi:nitrite reductase (NO-forming)
MRTENERRDVIAYVAAATAPAASPSTSARPAASAAAPPPAPQRGSVTYIPDVRYTLRSGIAEGRMVFLGVGGNIDGQVNPVLSAAEGQVVQITLINGEGAEHDVVFPAQNAKSLRITARGASTTMAFLAEKAGDFTYICSVPGHELAGMKGQFLVTPRPPAQTVVEAVISREAIDVPPPIGNRPPQTVKVNLISVEVEGRLAEGVTFGYWTFNGKVPGPFLRVRVGDTVEVNLKNAADSSMIHSVDFHAATGPGGGAVASQVGPGHDKTFKFKALMPGLYVYHCATPMVAHHIANGMYGLILVEPEGGLPPVDHELYVMQGEIYTEAPFGQHGSQEFSVEKLLNERPEYFVFNGSVGALSKLHPMKAKVGDTVRIYFGVGGPNYTSSFHVIGEIFDRVFNMGDVISPPMRGVQTTTVPAGGAAIVEFKLDVPGNYILVDHALSRAERGLIGILQVEGQPNPEIFDGKVDPAVAH